MLILNMLIFISLVLIILLFGALLKKIDEFKRLMSIYRNELVDLKFGLSELITLTRIKQ